MTVREFLFEMDKKADELEPKDKKALWDVLTAMRGPDKIEGASHKKFMEFKGATTAVIRFAALPLLSSAFQLVMQNPDDAEKTRLRNTLRTKRRKWPTAFAHRNKHFFQHADAAFRALDLEF